MNMLNKVVRYFKYIFISTPKPQKWVFIVGTTNSGTTLMHHLLALHPSIGSMKNEGQFYTDQLAIPKKKGEARLWTKNKALFYLNEITPTTINVKRIKKQWALYYNDPNRPILMDKTPVNSLRVRWLQKEFSNAYFIGMYRNGYAVSEGIARKTGCSIAEAAEHWFLNNQIMVEDFELLNNKMILKYEDLVEDPYKIAQGIFDFLNIDPLSKEQILRKYFIHGIESEVLNMNNEAIDRLTQADIETINEKAGIMLKYFNYHPNSI